jgi:H+/gluconate symporter-like permease
MFYIVLVLLLFMVTVAAHILYCRYTDKPGLHARIFVNMAILALGIYAALVFLLPTTGMIDAHSLWGMPFKVTAGAIFFLLVPFYLCFYVLTQLTSPSKKILLTISQRGELEYADVLACVKEEDFISSRLNDLCASRCVIQNNGRYIITSEGQKVAAILNAVQFFLGRNMGG